MCKIHGLLATVSSLLLLSACVSVKDELFLRNIEVDGSPSQPPVHFTSADAKKGDVTVSPQLSIGSGTVTTSLDPQFEGQVPDSLPDFKIKGLSWNMPRVTFGLDLDYAASNSFALNGGVSASISTGRQFTSLYAGIGLFSADPVTSVRFDVGVQYVDVQYTGATVVLRTIGSGPQDTIYYLDRGKEFQFNMFANLTINSSDADRGLNWFVQIGISPQTLTNFVPEDDVLTTSSTYVRSDQRAQSSVFWISATPGFTFSLGENRRLLLGARFLKEVLSESSQPGVVIIPMVQFDWRL
jgi:hypothetical protein